MRQVIVLTLIIGIILAGVKYGAADKKKPGKSDMTGTSDQGDSSKSECLPGYEARKCCCCDAHEATNSKDCIQDMYCFWNCVPEDMSCDSGVRNNSSALF